jgi:4-hydroxy-3-polyprenylbenzoate decarboxylase
MAVMPCSMGTLGRIAHGVSTGLADRAADVCLKERRRLVLVPRETPYSTIHLENMLKVSLAGAIVLPASPGLYAGATTVEQLVDFVVCRALDHLGIENDLMQRYGEPAKRRHPEDE